MAMAASLAAAKLHVENIRTNKFAIGNKQPNPLTKDLHNAVTSLSAELYTKDIHFLMELIQVIHRLLYEVLIFKPYMHYICFKFLLFPLAL